MRVHLNWREHKIDIISKWLHQESSLMFTLSNDKDLRKNSCSRSVNKLDWGSRSLSVNRSFCIFVTGNSLNNNFNYIYLCSYLIFVFGFSSNGKNWFCGKN